MQRKQFLQYAFTSAVAAAMASRVKGLSSFLPDWEIKMLTKDFGIFKEAGGTIGFHLADDGITITDAQFPPSAKHLIEELKKYNIPLNLLINTHHHRDHTAGNIAFKGIVNDVLAHENSLINQKKSAKAKDNEAEQYYPTQTYKDFHKVDTGKESIALHYFGPAHTNGDSYVHFEHNNIVHVGDLVFNRRHPFIDRGAGASVANWIQVLNDGIKTFDNTTTFVCGHSGNGYPVVGKSDMLQAFGNYLEHLLLLVEKEIKAGKSKEEILKATTIPGATEWKGDGIARPLTAAYEELTERK